jgi:hypothetical protein
MMIDEQKMIEYWKMLGRHDSSKEHEFCCRASRLLLTDTLHVRFEGQAKRLVMARLRSHESIPVMDRERRPPTVRHSDEPSRLSFQDEDLELADILRSETPPLTSHGRHHMSRNFSHNQGNLQTFT